MEWNRLEDGSGSADLSYYHTDDNAADRKFVKILTDLANGGEDYSPSDAAEHFLQWIISMQHNGYFKRDNPQVRIREGSVPTVFPCIVELCSIVPPNTHVQDRIIKFFRAMEKTRMDYKLRDRDDYYQSSCDPNFTWAAPQQNWGYWPCIFKLQAKKILAWASKTTETDDKLQLRSRNLQSAMVRLSAEGLINCRLSCAMELALVKNGELYPGRNNPDLSRDQQLRVLGLHAIAAAPWFLGDGTAEYCYKLCCSHETRYAKWNPEKWRSWRSQFELVAGAEGVDDEARQVAGEVVQRMAELEETKPGGCVLADKPPDEPIDWEARRRQYCEDNDQPYWLNSDEPATNGPRETLPSPSPRIQFCSPAGSSIQAEDMPKEKRKETHQDDDDSESEEPRVSHAKRQRR